MLKVTLTTTRPSRNISRVYVWPKGESIMANLVNRRDRPHNEWKPLVAAALREKGVEFQRLDWSQYAGCSCPCSPGFIVRGHRGFDYHFDLTEEEAPVHAAAAGFANALAKHLDR